MHDWPNGCRERTVGASNDAPFPTAEDRPWPPSLTFAAVLRYPRGRGQSRGYALSMRTG
jgi:hypothetical protein